MQLCVSTCPQPHLGGPNGRERRGCPRRIWSNLGIRIGEVYNRSYGAASVRPQVRKLSTRTARRCSNLSIGRISKRSSAQDISYTDTLLAMPLRATLRRVGFSPLASSRLLVSAFSTTGSVTTIEREAARPWTREAMFTVWPK
jgi:hypothetical protein